MVKGASEILFDECEVTAFQWKLLRATADAAGDRRRVTAIDRLPEVGDDERIVQEAYDYTCEVFPKGEAVRRGYNGFIYYASESHKSKEYRHMTRIAVDWYEHGKPTVVLGHKLASSFMMTNTPVELLREVRAPFSTVCIMVPNDLLFLEGESTSSIFVSHAFLDSVVALMRTGKHVGSKMYMMTASTLRELLNIPADAANVQYALMARRLIVGVFTYMTSNGPMKRREKSGRSKRKGPPEKIVFQLTQSVKHNFKQVVRDYVAGKSRKMTLQTVVRGHWKRQRCGKGGTERKRIFIEPYWRGPEDAPVALRPHVL